MRYVEPPDSYKKRRGDYSLFLAGGISGCPDWQSRVVQEFSKWSDNFVILNPRRKYFDIYNSAMAAEQIRWEYEHLSRASGILFWFCADTIQPISLFELGRHSTKKSLATKNGHRRIFVGTDENYERRFDIVHQLSMVDHRMVINNTLEVTMLQAKRWAGFHLMNTKTNGLRKSTNKNVKYSIPRVGL